MDFKSLISKLDSMEAPPETPRAPKLPEKVQLDEDAQLRVLAGTSTILAEAEIMEKKLTKAEKEKKEEVVKSMKKDKAGFKERYGKRGEEVMHATATKIAKKKAESVEEDDESLSEAGLDMNLIKAAQGGMSSVKKDPESERNRDKPYGYRSDKAVDDDDDDMEHPKDRKGKKKAKKESIDTEQFRDKFFSLVEAKKKEAEKKMKGKKAEEKMDEAAKPDFLDVDKDGDKKEPMKKAANEAGKGEKKDAKKGMSAKQAKYFGKKNESVKTSKKVVAESVEPKMTFRDMMKLVVESGGQQQIDPLDKALFSWATRVAKNKLGEGMKAEVYAGLVYERMGGRFEMFDVLSENKK
jgi:hypothetical protein